MFSKIFEIIVDMRNCCVKMQFSGYIRGKENSINCIFLKGNAKYQFSFHENTMPKIFSIMNSKFVWGLLLGEGNAKIKLLFVRVHWGQFPTFLFEELSLLIIKRRLYIYMKISGSIYFYLLNLQL